MNITSVFPNPFITTAIIEYDLRQTSSVQILIFNQFGKLVENIQQIQSSGKQQVVWDANGLPNGMYYFVLEIGSEVRRGKIIKLSNY